VPNPQVIREKYCITASGYDELYAEEQLRKYDVVFRAHTPSGTLLDIGAGTCLLLEYLVARRKHLKVKYYIALDLTPCMLGLCRRRVEALKLGYLVDIVEAEASHLPLRDNSVDESYAFTVFDLLYKPEKGIAEQVRVTRRIPVYTLLHRVEASRRFSLCGASIGATDKDVICLPRASYKVYYDTSIGGYEGGEGQRFALTTPYIPDLRRNPKRV